MPSRPAPGEVALAIVFAAAGVVWIVGALGHPLWDGFAPSSGFMPLIYGILLAVLSLAVVASLFFSGEATDGGPVGKPLLVLAAVAAAVIGVDVAGFGLAVFLMLLFLFAAVERLRLLPSLLVAAGTTAALILVFKIWLGVPLPAGPWGV